MPKLHHLEKLTENLSIGVQIGAGSTRGSSGVWNARFTWPSKKPAFRTLKVKYEAGSTTNKSLAIERAYKVAAELAPQAASGKDYHKKNYLNELVESYLKETDRYTQENQQRKERGATLKHKVHGGRAFWNKDMSNQTNAIFSHAIKPWLKEKFATVKQRRVERAPKVKLPKGDPNIGVYAGTLPTQEFIKEYTYPVITNMTKRQWDTLDTWIQDQEDLDYGIEYRLKCISALRKFLSWCFEQQIIDDVPSIKRPSRGGKQGVRERMRKEIRPEQYTAIINYQREKYLDADRPMYYRQWAYLFHLWTLIISNTGIRPPTGGTESTMIKWEHVNIDTDRPTLTRPFEKTRPYEAIIMPNAVAYFQELKAFYQRFGMSTEKGYVFAHWRNQGDEIIKGDWEEYDTKTRTTGLGTSKRTIKSYKTKPAIANAKKARWLKGDPIISFRKQWVDMIKALGYYVEGGKQADNISPSSLRAWFITQRLYSDDNFRIEELAEYTGTSVDQIQQRYFRLDMSKSYEHLTAGGYDREGKKATYDKDGFYAGFK